MSNIIEVGDIEKAINDELTLYCDSVTKKIKKASDDVMEDLVKNTKKDAPTRKGKSGGKYKRAITSKRVLETKRCRINKWYVRDPEYRLSHLLEKGHATRNGGRTKAFGFISKNEQIAVKEYERRVKEAAKNES